MLTLMIISYYSFGMCARTYLYIIIYYYNNTKATCRDPSNLLSTLQFDGRSSRNNNNNRKSNNNNNGNNNASHDLHGVIQWRPENWMTMTDKITGPPHIVVRKSRNRGDEVQMVTKNRVNWWHVCTIFSKPRKLIFLFFFYIQLVW